MLAKILWESFSIALLLYGSYLIYVFLWFSIVRVWDINTIIAKGLSGTIIMVVLLYSFYKWFKRKYKEVKEMKKNENL